MNIGFDLDKVFIDYPPLIPQTTIDWLYKHSIKELIHPGDSHLHYNIPKNRYAIMIRKLSHHRLLRPKISRNIAFLEYLKSNYPQINLYLISSRYSFLENTTIEILRKYEILPYFQKIFLNSKDEQPHIFKQKIINRVKIDLYIDDDLNLLEHLRKNCVKTGLLWYHPDANKSHIDHIKQISSLTQVVGYININKDSDPIISSQPVEVLKNRLSLNLAQSFK